MCRADLLERQAEKAEALARQKTELDAAMQRHLDLIDRLLADKDALSERVDAAAATAAARDVKHAQALAALKRGWAAELTRQREAWTAAEKV